MRTAEEEIQEQYEVLGRVGIGSFGHIFSIKSKKNLRIFACKVEKSHGKKSVLVEKQYKILVELAHLPHFPKVYSFKRLKENSFIVMQLLGKNLQQVFIEHKKLFSLSTVAIIAHQQCTALRDLHQAGYLHRDLKPENMMIKDSDHQIRLIDFGLADHLKVRRAVNLIGNVRFCSRNSHFGLSSKREDLQSLMFILFYFATGSLPWQNSTKQEIQIEIKRNNILGVQPKTPILSSKQIFLEKAVFNPTRSQVKKAFHEQFMGLCRYIFGLHENEQPNYSWILNRCDRLLILANTRKDNCFDWCPKLCPNRSKGELWDIFT